MLTLVTGASGHVGANLVPLLLREGREVRALVHDEAAALDGLPVERVRGDVRDPESLARALDGVSVVYHLAARISLRRADAALVEQTNVGGVRNLVDACLAAGVRRLVHFSSIHAFSPEPADAPVDETRAPNALARSAPYDRSKARGEAIVREAVARGLDAVILNPTGIVGPCDYRLSHFGRVLLDLWRRRLPALVDGGFHWVDARDVAAAAIAAEQRGRTGEGYLLAGPWASIAEVASIVSDLTGVPPPRLRTPGWLARATAPLVEDAATVLGRRPIYTRASIEALRCYRDIRADKARRELGFEPRPLRETIADALAWLGEAHGLRLPAPPERTRAVG